LFLLQITAIAHQVVALFAGEIPPGCVVLSTPSEDDRFLLLEVICPVMRDISAARTTFTWSSSVRFPFIAICLSAQLWLWTALMDAIAADASLHSVVLDFLLWRTSRSFQLSMIA
jgi:hypothetical protein